MKRVLCDRLPETHRPTPLAEAESTHLTRVLRLKDGDLVEAMDGKGHSAAVKLRTHAGLPRLEFVEKATSSTDLESQKIPVVLEMSVLKGDAMEWVVEKAVELGVTTFIPVITAHTVVQLDKKGPEAFRERWQKIADQALKQCGRLDRMEIKTPIELESLLIAPMGAAKEIFSGKLKGSAQLSSPSESSVHSSKRLWCDEASRADAVPLLRWLESTREQPRDSIRLLVGPEGGWSERERELLSREGSSESKIFTQCVSLGPLVLRAETAAIFAISLASADFRAKRNSTQA